MEKDTYKSNIKTLKELILDEQKLVTYVSLSKDLCIHVNDAKTLLNNLVQDIRQNQPKTEIYVCYLISGLLDNNNAVTTVCPEKELEAFKKTLKIIFYEHIYCVSRGMKDVDNVALTAINKFEDFSLCEGLIKAHSCIKRSDSEIADLRSSMKNIGLESNSNSAVKKKSTEKPKDEIKNGHADTKKVFDVKSEPVKSKTPSPKKDQLFTNNKTGAKTGNKPASKGIAGFFNKTNGDANKNKSIKVKEEKTENTAKTEKQVSKEVEVKKEKQVSKEVEVKTEKQVGKEKEVKVKPNTAKNDSFANNKPEVNNKPKQKVADSALKAIKKNAKVDKKRKRVLLVSDSESENETNDPFAEDENKMAVDQDSEDEIPPTPSANTVKITSGIVNPKKRRKVIDKTYTDEDGYILTKKEEIYESCSDNEDERKENIKEVKENTVQVTQVKVEISPKENGKAKKKKVSPPQKGKQQTLTNFFKKV